MHIITKSVVPGDLVFDIGANLGDKTEWFASRQIQVIAVEPQPNLVEQLRTRFASNSLVTVIGKGLAAAPGELTMSLSTNHVLSTFSNDWKSGRFAGQAWDSTAVIEVVTLDQIVAQFGVPRYAKIDVEGYEKQVLLGLSQKIGILSFEFTAEFIETAQEICEHLLVLGYRFFNFSLGENDEFELDASWISCEGLFSALHFALSKEQLLWGDIYAA